MFFDHALLDVFAKGALLSALGLIWIVLLVRMTGLRSFSKMTNLDFVMTIGMGSLIAGAAQSNAWVDLVQTMTAMAALFCIQFGVSYLRQRSDKFENVIQNRPVVLMRHGKILSDALRVTRVSESDLMAKLREANATSLSDVRAVVLETTGDVSVLNGDSIDAALLDGIAQST